jgi:hypothetical protein
MLSPGEPADQSWDSQSAPMRQRGVSHVAVLLKNRGTPDRDRISLDEEYEVQYWTKTLGVSREELERTVRSVGNSVDAVRRALKKTV